MFKLDDYKYGYTLGLIFGIGMGICLCLGLLPKPTTLEEFCKGNPEVLLTLEGKGLSDGTLYLKCNGKLYQSSIEVITHQYDKSNNHVRIYGNSGLPVEDFEIDTVNGGV